MTVEFTRGPVRLICGDALDVLPTLNIGAQLVVTDPPYQLTSGGSPGSSMQGLFAAYQYDNGGDLMAMVQWRQIGGPIFRACVPNADCYVMANDKNIFAAREGFIGAGWRFHNLLYWDKGAPTRNRWYMKNAEFTLYLWKGKARVITHVGSKQGFSCPRPKGAIHPTQKPVELLRHYIENSSDAGDVVLDPFAGSAATLVAAAMSGRQAIGIEVDRDRFEKAVARSEGEL